MTNLEYSNPCMTRYGRMGAVRFSLTRAYIYDKRDKPAFPCLRLKTNGWKRFSLHWVYIYGKLGYILSNIH